MSVVKNWHSIVKHKDIQGLNNILAENAIFYSPVVHTPQHGKQITFMYLYAAFQVLFNPSFHYVREIVSEQHAVLEFEVEIDGILVNGVDMLTWNEQQQITEFKVMIRPLKAIQLIHAKMAEMLGKN